MADRYHSDDGMRIETISYAPGLQDSNDLEAGTKVINATGEPGTSDYSASLALPAPADSRLSVLRIGVRLQVTIDSWAGGGTTLNYRIKRNGVSIGTGTLATGAATGARYAAHDVTTGPLTGAGSYEVFLWVNSGSCTVSVCRLWAGVGSCNAAWYGVDQCLHLARQSGMITFFIVSRCEPYGGGVTSVPCGGDHYNRSYLRATQENEPVLPTGSWLIDDVFGLYLGSGVATNLAYLMQMTIIVSSRP